MIRKKIIFRADGNSKTGYGHISRCTALAEMLNNKHECYLLTKEINEVLRKQISEIFKGIIIIDKSLSISGELKLISDSYVPGENIIVLDGYSFDSKYQKYLKKNKYPLVCIDDMCKNHIYADLLINHAPGILPNKYKTEKYTRKLLGLEYAILRNYFLKNTNIDREIKKTDKLFLCFGGSDIFNLTTKLLKSLETQKLFKKIVVVIGNGYLFEETLKRTIKNSKLSIKLYKSIDNIKMVKLMKECQFAIVPSSNILIECIALKLPFLTGYYIDNQKKIANYFSKNRIGINTGNLLTKNIEDFDKIISNLTPKIINKIIEDIQFLIDGKSKYRILNEIDKLNGKNDLTIRNAAKKDCKIYYEWVNESEVRKNSINKDVIQYEEHKKWYNGKLENKNSFLFIFDYKNKPIGQVRFDKIENKYLIDYSVDKQSRGLGFGKLILGMAIDEMKNIFPKSKYLAYVKKNNKSSCMAFDKLLFEKYKTRENKYFKYTLN